MADPGTYPIFWRRRVGPLGLLVPLAVEQLYGISFECGNCTQLVSITRLRSSSTTVPVASLSPLQSMRPRLLHLRCPGSEISPRSYHNTMFSFGSA